MPTKLRTRRGAQPEEAPAQGQEEERDGCDLRIDEADATPDEDLPAAEGGVE
jgi:hypothetical protein